MTTFEGVVHALRKRQYRVSIHAGRELVEDALLEDDVIVAPLGGEAIEDYPGAFPWPACLVLGRLDGGEPVHAVWAFDATNGYAVLVTAYRPDPERWSEEFRKRVT
jgi:hypothetical protein